MINDQWSSYNLNPTIQSYIPVAADKQPAKNWTIPKHTTRNTCSAIKNIPAPAQQLQKRHCSTCRKSNTTALASHAWNTTLWYDPSAADKQTCASLNFTKTYHQENMLCHQKHTSSSPKTTKKALQHLQSLDSIPPGYERWIKKGSSNV